MSVIGIGVDLVKISRIRQAVRRRGDRFVNRILGHEEQQKCLENVAYDSWIAGRFAVKEACLKALGTGWAEGVSFPQVHVLEGGAIRYSGKAGERAEALGVVGSRYSLAVDGDLVSAMVILEG